MEPYIVLIGFIFLFWFFSGIYPNPKHNNIFLCLTFIYLYLFCSVRSFEVGRDVPGYIQMYEKTATVPWSDWDYVYFESGYIALMKICNIAGLSAREFFFVIYSVILFPIYLFVKKRSPLPLLSVIIYISFQFFVFDLTGLRQAIGMSICMLAYIVASEKKSMRNLSGFILLVCLAATFHTSALIFLFAYPVMKMPMNRRMIIIYCLSAVICFGLNIACVRTLLTYFDKSQYDYSSDDSQQLGFTFVALCLIAILAVWTCCHTKRQMQNQIKQAANILLASICILLLFNGSVLLRSGMYYYFPMIISIPMYVKSLTDRNLRMIASVGIAIVFLIFFFTRDIYNFDVMPYSIGTDLYSAYIF